MAVLSMFRQPGGRAAWSAGSCRRMRCYRIICGRRQVVSGDNNEDNYCACEREGRIFR